ncbi:hypothetical protein TcasGA2_TC008098 [Tribolium castaneum]|uniref:Uncharacterized protein n=1 Tax=Tribolium castaneum TaxID=7070 RepID=D1ZZS7_TRICA|nr:hypothetical protein TcasGA2_TC008098 [Tribolium castaneum]
MTKVKAAKTIISYLFGPTEFSTVVIAVLTTGCDVNNFANRGPITQLIEECFEEAHWPYGASKNSHSHECKTTLVVPIGRLLRKRHLLPRRWVSNGIWPLGLGEATEISNYNVWKESFDAILSAKEQSLLLLHSTKHHYFSSGIILHKEILNKTQCANLPPNYCKLQEMAIESSTFPLPLKKFRPRTNAS